MFIVFNGYSSFFSLIYNNIINIFSYFFLLPLLCTFVLFLSYRFPYCYSPFLLYTFLIVFIFSAFLSLFFSRVMFSVSEFFSSFVPMGTPLYITPLVCIAETISYIIRPFVLILRPFINLSLGCLGAVSLCNLCFVNSFWFFVLFILFFYEVFVAVVHWYIVTSILLFSVEH